MDMATITSAGHVSTATVRGEADALSGLARWREVWWRLRRKHGRADALRIMVKAFGRGVTLSGPRMH